MKYKVQSFGEILQEIERENSGIILGNGFCSWLYEKVEGNKKLPKRYEDWDLDEIIRYSIKLFNENDSENIEFILNNSDIDVDKIYSQIIEKNSKHLADKWLICFFKAILKRANHDRIKKSLNVNKLKCILEKVEFKFTTNYDPTFYWLSLQIKKMSKRRTIKQINESKRGGINTEFDDGFDRNEENLIFIRPEKSTIFYLHGAIFLIVKYLSKKVETIKISSKNNTNKDFINVCEEYLKDVESINNNFLLLTVIGKDKIKQIEKSQYLDFSLNKLKKCKTIITFGLSFREDLHLLKNIIKQCNDYKQPKYLYIGCYNLETDKVNNPRVNFESYFKNNAQPDNLNIIFYESKDINDLKIYKINNYVRGI